MIKFYYIVLYSISFTLTGPPANLQLSPNGFYVVIENKTNCSNAVNTLTEAKSYCLPNDPIIEESEFENVGNIQFDEARDLKQFDLKLSLAGFEILKTLAIRLPDSKIALVIGGHIAGIYQSKGKLINRTLPIRGAYDSYDIEWIHEKIKKKKP